MDQTVSLVIDVAGERTTLGRFALTNLATGERLLRDGEGRTTIGSALGNDVQLRDEAVSRFHCRIDQQTDGAHLSDIGSSNGTYVQGVRIASAWLQHGAVLQVGGTQLRFEVEGGERHAPLGDERFGPLVGRSGSARRFFAGLERAAASDANLLIGGPTGTGKSVAARAVHDASRRGGGPFELIDLASINRGLVGSELFGHERGAFTGAELTVAGPFERANGGTVFLDEIGELPLELQPVLLRVLESRRVRRLGGVEERLVDVRVVAATHRDLREAVNEGRFRADLFYRLAVLELQAPGLEERAEDMPLLCEALFEHMAVPMEERRIPAETMHQLMQAKWPGNIRQLRNRLERLLIFGDWRDAPEGGAAPVHYAEARKAALADFEQRYVEQLLAAYEGDVQRAAHAAGIAPGYLYRLIKRSGR